MLSTVAQSVFTQRLFLGFRFDVSYISLFATYPKILTRYSDVLNSKKLPRGSPSDGECMARHILKYIFPLEYGLPSRLFPGKAQDPAQNLDEKVKV
jgi:hypothetical protein